MTLNQNTANRSLQGEFDERGYVILSDFLEPAVVSAGRMEMEKLVDQQADRLIAAGKVRDRLANEPFETRFFKLYEHCLDDAPKSFRRELHLSGLFDLFFHSHLLDVVEGLLGGEIRLYPNYTARPKFPDWEGTQVLWHQDGGYTEQLESADGKVETLRMVNVWTPLVPAHIENGCMQFIPGTQKLGTVSHGHKKHYLKIVEEYLKPRLDQAVNI